MSDEQGRLDPFAELLKRAALLKRQTWSSVCKDFMAEQSKARPSRRTTKIKRRIMK